MERSRRGPPRGRQNDSHYSQPDRAPHDPFLRVSKYADERGRSRAFFRVQAFIECVFGPGWTESRPRDNGRAEPC
ncbi:hypothetical protein FRUB_04738 [Fimbriiglobus ruber]|uniref:Uncharacterized protein n=1 Tax=Fimbriiglobus ruber TaxID=1908690 RepID=A0A225DTE2_9BACT|nr:hypothetical protein FRUB_04738 [Fimbriiglobus ruber]